MQSKKTILLSGNFINHLQLTDNQIGTINYI